jgi:hypothetical protein
LFKSFTVSNYFNPQQYNEVDINIDLMTRDEKAQNFEGHASIIRTKIRINARYRF